jgi:hypothetical protein
MKVLSNLTRNQKSMAFPLLIGLLVGITEIVNLFNIPSDPKNSLIFGFSSFRLIEGVGLLTVSLSCLIFLVICLRNDKTAEKIVPGLGWLSKNPWSVALGWIVLSLCLLIFIFGEKYYPGYASIIIRLNPVLIWAIIFDFAFLLSYLFRAGLKSFRTTGLFLLKVSLIGIGGVFIFGLVMNPAKFGLILRQGRLVILLVLMSNLVLAFQQKGFVRYASSFVTIGLLFGGAITGVWTGAISDLNIVAGLLPYNDANGYFHGGRLVAEGQLMHPFSAKRPLFSALMGVFLWLTNQNLKLTIGFMVAIGGLVAYFSSLEIRKIAGAVAAAFLVLGIFVFSRRFIGSTMSEVIGLPLGLVGFALLWSGAVRQRLSDIAGGMLMVSFGLLSRAGPFFLLPLLVIWSGWGLRGEKKYHWKAFIITALAAGVGFGLNALIYYFLAGSNSAPMGNFSYTIYGLVVGGKGWKQYIVDHPDVLQLVEPIQSQAIYRYAWEAFLANPFASILGAFKYWGSFFSFEWYGAFGYIEGASKSESLIGRVAMAILSLAGIGFIIKDLRKPVVSMLFAGVIGILLSVPFVPPLDAEIRTYAAAIPWFVGLGMLGLIGLISLFHKSELAYFAPESSNSPIGLWVTSICLVILMVFAPLTIHFLKTPMQIPQQTSCLAEEDTVITTVHRGSYINIRKDDAIQKTVIPDIRTSDFIRSLHDSPMYRLAVQLIPIMPGTSYLTSYNWADKQFENILAPTEILDQNQGWVEMCGWRETEPDQYGFFHAESVRLLEQ